MRKIILTAFFSILVLPVYAFQHTFKFGEIPREQLEQTIYSIDSTANAIVLFDAGESYVDTDMNVRFKRHIRIKILTDAGLEQGDISISYREGDPEQDIKDLEAVSYTLMDNDEIRESKLGRRDHFTEKINDNWNRLKFSVPGLTAGSVFEYRYEIVSESPVDLKGWKFQQDIPVLWSEYSASIPEWYDFLTLVRSFYPLEINSRSTYQSNVKVRYSTYNSNSSNTNENAYYQRKVNKTAYVDYQGTTHTWAMKDIPSITDEPYLNSAEDYAAKVIMQLNSYQYPYSKRENVLSTWLDLIDIVEKSGNFGDHLHSYGRLKEAVTEVTSEEQTDEEKLITLYNLVRNRMNLDEDYQFFIGEPLDDIFQKGTGNSSEINMILVQLLKEAGIESYPLMLSTRSHGEVLDMFPIIEQFNHAIAYAKIGEKEYKLDAIHKDRPYHLLPVADLNGRGIVINPENPKWVPLVYDEVARETQSVLVNLASEGKFKGTIQSKETGAFSYTLKKYFTGDDSLDKAHDFLFGDSKPITLETLITENREEENSFTYEAQFSGSETLIEEAGVLYINPFFIQRVEENPFQRMERKYPVDFNFPFVRQTITKINFPEGWEPDEIPQ